MKGLIPLLGLALLFPGTAEAEVVAPGVSQGALAVARDGSPRVAWLEGRRLLLATRDGAWRPTSIATLPTVDGRVAGVSENAVLVEGRRTWIRLVVRSGSRWRVLVVAEHRSAPCLASRASRSTPQAGPRSRMPSRRRTTQRRSSSSGWRRAGASRARGSPRKGFPMSLLPPAAAPVLWPDGTIRVVESFSQRGANAILWRREGKRWRGRVLHASALGAAPLPLYAAAAADGVYVAWTIPYVTFGENHLVLSSRIDRSTSLVLHPNAFAAALVLGPSGPEIAANEPGDSVVGFLTGSVQTELDGRSRRLRGHSDRRPSAARSHDRTGSSGSSCLPFRRCE